LDCNTEDIYFGVFRMDTVRIGDFLGELYGLSCCVCGVRNVFICRKKTRVSLYYF
jgi:hypothetical protein